MKTGPPIKWAVAKKKNRRRKATSALARRLVFKQTLSCKVYAMCYVDIGLIFQKQRFQRGTKSFLQSLCCKHMSQCEPAGLLLKSWGNDCFTYEMSLSCVTHHTFLSTNWSLSQKVKVGYMWRFKRWLRFANRTGLSGKARAQVSASYRLFRTFEAIRLHGPDLHATEEICHTVHLAGQWEAVVPLHYWYAWNSFSR